MSSKLLKALERACGGPTLLHTCPVPDHLQARLQMSRLRHGIANGHRTPVCEGPTPPRAPRCDSHAEACKSEQRVPDSAHKWDPTCRKPDQPLVARRHGPFSWKRAPFSPPPTGRRGPQPPRRGAGGVPPPREGGVGQLCIAFITFPIRISFPVCLFCVRVCVCTCYWLQELI